MCRPATRRPAAVVVSGGGAVVSTGSSPGCGGCLAAAGTDAAAAAAGPAADVTAEGVTTPAVGGVAAVGGARGHWAACRAVGAVRLLRAVLGMVGSLVLHPL